MNGYSQSGIGAIDSVVRIPYPIAVGIWRDLADYDLLKQKEALQARQLRAYEEHVNDLKSILDMQANRITRHKRRHIAYLAAGLVAGIIITK